MNTPIDKTESIRILYYGAGWPTNIGNAFIDLGAMAILREAAPDAQISFASEMPRWFCNYRFQRFKPKGPGRFLPWNFFKANHGLPKMDCALDIASVTQCDLVVFAGMAMCEEFSRINGKPILELTNRRIPVLLLGTGALTYTDKERELYADFLRRVKPIGFVSRDDQSYEMFSEVVPESLKGIDCAFFVPEAYQPFPLEIPPYIVVTFDSMPEPSFSPKGRKLVRAHHACWKPSLIDYQYNDHTLISDIPQDYLALYANAEEVHSDRVHACIAALAYGRKAKLYHPTPRGSLFTTVGANGIRDALIQINRQLLKEKKELQVKFVKDLISARVRRLQHSVMKDPE
ncbi:MAG: polysaccharide pyruvyl transferase family protein [Deltaproteobacteria bacterium]|nr:polysaccharide pyruvyl transferase family protein [Deltaproteobacteria bacterium]